MRFFKILKIFKNQILYEQFPFHFSKILRWIDIKMFDIDILEAIIPIMEMMVEDWSKSKNKQEERSIMIRRAQTARIIIICAYCIMMIACAFIIMLPAFGMSMRLTTNITDPGRPMPLQTHYIYDVTKRPQYELTFISQAVYIVLAIMSYTGIDNFLGLLILHICGQLDILKSQLTHLDKHVNSHNMLKYCVAKHIRLLRFATCTKCTDAECICNIIGSQSDV